MPTFQATPRGKWITFIVWMALIFGALAANLPGKFTEAEKNDSISFLPGSAESTKALNITERLRGGDTAPTVVVFYREGGLTDADKQQIVTEVGELNTATEAFGNTTPFGNPEDPESDTPFQLSEDGTTALAGNVIRGTGESDDILEPVDAYRDAVSSEGEDGGLVVKVGGPSGIAADAIKVFENINGTLLLAALVLVLVLLVLIYRSPIFWIFPFFAVGVSEIAARSLGFGLTELGVTVNGQSSSIMSVLVLGAGTDYALLLVARYKEELRRHADKHEAMQLALKAGGPAIVASGMTVAVTLLSLMLAQVNGTAGLGPTGAAGVFVALVTMLTLLPAILVIVPRKVFWPSIPHYGDTGADETHGAWRKIGERVSVRPRRVWIGTSVVLAIFALGCLNFSTGLTQGNAFRDDVEGVQAQELVANAFPAGESAPMDVIVRDPARTDAVVRALEDTAGVADVRRAESGDGVQLLAVFLDVDPFSTAAYDEVDTIREAARSADPSALVGGSTAVEKDLRDASADDTRLLVPLALVIVFVILVLLLRSIVAPVLLIATVVLSFLAALGVSAVVFDVIFGFPGSDPSLPLFAFIFLVALGVDYNIFLMARAREETARFGTRPGMLRAVAVTGGVITSAGIVLAGTFSVLAVLPLVFLTQIGFVIAFGVLLDTFIVRTILVPALTFDLGGRIWKPSALAEVPDHPELEERDARGPAGSGPAPTA